MKRLFCLAIILLPLLVSCAKNKTKQLVLWTNRVEFISYTELYNSLQDDAKIIALYKDAPETALPPKKNEQKPDIIVGTFLQSGMKEKHFANLDSLFKKNALDAESFYPVLLESGQLDGKQYLLPVSFNLPALIFQTRNYDYAQSKLFSFEEIKEVSKKFNSQKKDKTFTAMGFAPHWSLDFLYLILKTAGVMYSVQNNQMSYSEYAFNNVLDSINDWSVQVNGSVQNEQDFAFKYLYMPFYNQIQSGRCLFSYAPSDKIMSLSEEQLEEIDFRWICNDNKIQIEDDAVMAGIFAESKNKAAAKDFLVWFMNEDSQKKMLERKFTMKLRTATFGIAGGFSSIQSVNQKLFPIYYRTLLANLPVSELLATPQIFPSDWAAIKEHVVIPFIAASTENSGTKNKSLYERYNEYISLKESFQH